MIIRGLEIVGWMPFAEPIKLELPDGPIAIVGRHAGDTRRSNRSGKTAFLEAINWCLFNEHRKRTDNDIINRSCDKCLVRIELDTYHDRFVITRSKARDQAVKLHVVFEGVEYVGDAAQVEIESFVGLSFKDYVATSCFRQGDVDALIMRSSGERLAVVSEWLQQTKWLVAKKMQAARVARVSEELAHQRGQLNNQKAQVNTPALRKALADDLVRTEAARLQHEEKLGLINTRLRQSAELRALEEKHARLEQLRLQAAQIRKQMEAGPELRKKVAVLEEQWRIAESEADRAQAGLDELERLQTDGFDGKCPVMCKECPVADTVQSAVQDAAGIYHTIAADSEVKQHTSHLLSLSYRKVRNELTILEGVTGRYKVVVESGKQLSEELAQSPSIGSEDDAALEKELQYVSRLSHEATARIAEIKQILATAELADKRIVELVNEIETTEEASAASQLALKAIAAIPARIASEQLAELEQETNLLLQGTGVSMRFSWQRELADKSPTCDVCGFLFTSKRPDECSVCNAPRGKKLANELEILCDDGSGAEEDVRYNSGGTRAMVGSACRLAASGMLRRLRSSTAAWAVVDEPFGSLDLENREQLARTFTGMLGTVGLEQALVVSHDPLLLAALPHHIVIDKDGDASTVRLE